MSFLGNLLGLSPPKAPAAQPIVDQAAAMAAANGDTADQLRRRRGAAANELTGGGAEAQTPGGRALLGVAG